MKDELLTSKRVIYVVCTMNRYIIGTFYNSVIVKVVFSANFLLNDLLKEHFWRIFIHRNSIRWMYIVTRSMLPSILITFFVMVSQIVKLWRKRNMYNAIIAFVIPMEIMVYICIIRYTNIKISLITGSYQNLSKANM